MKLQAQTREKRTTGSSLINNSRDVFFFFLECREVRDYRAEFAQYLIRPQRKREIDAVISLPLLPIKCARAPRVYSVGARPS